MKKIITWAVIIFAGFYIFTHPHAAGSIASSPVHVLQDAGNALATFIHSL
jgi:hypothetical protein